MNAVQENDDASEEEAPAAAPEFFEHDGNTDLCVLCREVMMTAKKKHQLPPLS